MATDRPMQLGMAGLGRMGSNFVRRLMADGHRCVMYDLGPAAVATIAGEGATGASTTDELVAAPEPSCAIPAMAPAGEPTEVVVRELSERLEPGDVVIDGGNTHYRGDLRLSRGLTQAGILQIDCGTSGGVFCLQRGSCLMVGADEDVFRHLEPIFASLAPGVRCPRTPGREGEPAAAERGTCAAARWARATS